jgi:hypothetical protein
MSPGVLAPVARTENAATPPMTMDLMSEIASDEVLEQAFEWLCGRWHGYSPHQDVWDVRWRWREVKAQVPGAVAQGPLPARTRSTIWGR